MKRTKQEEKALEQTAAPAVADTVNPEEPQKKRRGRPKKEVPADGELIPAGPLPGKKRPGRPKKAAADAQDTVITREAPKDADSVIPAPEAVLEPSETSVYIQSVLGGTIAIDEIIARVHSLSPEAKEIYIKPEENKAYWVGSESQGYVILWD